MRHRPPRDLPLVFAIAFASCVALASPHASAGISDWIAELHGGAPPAQKAPPPATLAEVSTAPGVQSDPQVESFLRTLAAAVMARDGSLLTSRLAANYTVEGLPPGAKAANVMAQALEQMRGPQRIVVESVSVAAGLRTAKARFHFGVDDNKLRTFIFDRAGNLVGSDLFHLSHG